MVVFSGFELMALAGLRTMTRTVHARIEAGVTRSTIKALANSPARRRRSSVFSGSETNR